MKPLETGSSLPDWLLAFLTAFGMFVAGIFWIARLPLIQREQHSRLKRIEDKLDSMDQRLGRIDRTLDRNGIFQEIEGGGK